MSVLSLRYPCPGGSGHIPWSLLVVFNILIPGVVHRINTVHPGTSMLLTVRQVPSAGSPGFRSIHSPGLNQGVAEWPPFGK